MIVPEWRNTSNPRVNLTFKKDSRRRRSQRNEYVGLSPCKYQSAVGGLGQARWARLRRRTALWSRNKGQGRSPLSVKDSECTISHHHEHVTDPLQQKHTLITLQHDAILRKSHTKQGLALNMQCYSRTSRGHLGDGKFFGLGKIWSRYSS